jgi:hypothetical protein
MKFRTPRLCWPTVEIVPSMQAAPLDRQTINPLVSGTRQFSEISGLEND